MLAGLTDEELVSRAAKPAGGAATAAATDVLLRRYQERVYLWCFRMVRHHEQACDLSQECLLLAWRGLASFQGNAKFSSWLFSLVRNRCLSALRPRSLHRDEEIDPDTLIGSPLDPADEVAERDEERRVERVLMQTLDAQEQEAIWLRCIERMPVEAITELLQVTGSSGARGLLQTARRKLKAALSREGIATDGGASGWSGADAP